MSARILVAEDERVLRENLVELLSGSGYVVDSAGDGATALARMGNEDYALAIVDLRMPHLDGIGVLRGLAAEGLDTPVLIMTAYASVESAIEALRLGAHDYLLKPVVFEDLLKRVENVVAYRALKNEVGRLRKDITRRLGFHGIVGESPAIRDTFKLVEKVAPTNATVLITGESGTGKELIARAVHARSAVSEREFLAVNVSALPQDLVEATLFGHERGAFTGADKRREGLLRSVQGGTVFLDEIGDLPIPAQAKLLRALEIGEVLPVGADRPVDTRFRLIAATNHDLEAAISAGRFREDLYFRLNIFRIELPPLRERREDIPALVAHFVALRSPAQGKAPLTVTNEAISAMLGYAWPGNVRELSNVIERACILCEGDRLGVSHLPAELLAATDLPTGLRQAVEAFERRHIAWVLRAAGGNRERAARMLEVDPATLYRRLAKYQGTDER
jgi:two-component system response regulator HydG